MRLSINGILPRLIAFLADQQSRFPVGDGLRLPAPCSRAMRGRSGRPPERQEVEMTERVIGYALLAVAVMIGAEMLSTVLDAFDMLAGQGFRPVPHHMAPAGLILR